MISKQEIQGYANGMVAAVLSGMQQMPIPDEPRVMLEYIQEMTIQNDIQYDYNTAQAATLLFQYLQYPERVLVERIKEVFGKYVDLRNYPISGTLLDVSETTDDMEKNNAA